MIQHVSSQSGLLMLWRCDPLTHSCISKRYNSLQTNIEVQTDLNIKVTEVTGTLTSMAYLELCLLTV